MPPSFPQWITEQLKAEENKSLARTGVLFRAGEPVSKLYLLQSGEIRLARPLSHGDSLTIHRFLPGSVVAEASLFASHYHCDAVADRDSNLLCYNRKRVQNQLRSQPGFSERLCAYLSGEIQALRTKLELAHIKSADERLLTWIRLHASPSAVAIDRPLKSIASELGLAHETLYRSLRNLEDRQLIRRDRQQIVLTQCDSV